MVVPPLFVEVVALSNVYICRNFARNTRDILADAALVNTDAIIEYVAILKLDSSECRVRCDSEFTNRFNNENL